MQKLISRIKEYVSHTDVYGYKGWLVSDRFYKRLSAFIGYTFISLVTIEFIRIIIVTTVLFFQYK